MEQRAAVFTNRPQAVEVFQSGAWWPGELLGWRHDDSGACQVQVRVVLGGRQESAWTDLSALRLPERRLSVAAGPSLPADAERVGLPPAAVLRDVSAPADLSETVSLPLIRERSPNHPAGGRRRAAETEAMPAVPGGMSAPTAAAPARGRHRAPADPGRHRKADTGLLAVVPSDGFTTESSRPSAGRVARTGSVPPVRRRETWTAPDFAEPDLLTRPMRLSDHQAGSRHPRVDGSLNGACVAEPRLGAIARPEGVIAERSRRGPDPSRVPSCGRRDPGGVRHAVGALGAPCGVSWDSCGETPRLVTAGARRKRTRDSNACTSCGARPRLPLHLVVTEL